LLTEIHVGCSDRYYNANAADKLFGRKFCTRYAKIRNWDKKDKPADQAKLVLEQLANHVIEFEVADVMLSSIERMVKVIASTEHEERIAELEKQLLTLLDSDSANHYEPQDAIGDTGEAAPASKGK